MGWPTLAEQIHNGHRVIHVKSNGAAAAASQQSSSSDSTQRPRAQPRLSGLFESGNKCCQNGQVRSYVLLEVSNLYQNTF